MKVIITGGHFSPAYSVIQELDKTTEVFVLGRKNALEGDSAFSFEYTVCQKLGIPFFEIKAGRLSRRVTRLSLYSLLKFPSGFYDALKILRKVKPDIVLTFGGYISFPVAVAARALKIPVVIHEQTQRAGFSNKIIGKFAQKICVSFESSIPYFPSGKVVLTGNPVRKEIFKTSKEITSLNPEDKLIYVTGGSTGSHFINMLIEQTLEDILCDFVVIHQTGNANDSSDFKKLTERRESLNGSSQKRYIVREFIMPDEIGWIFKNAKLIISRSGVNSICEYIALKKSALLIPLPHGQTGEQLENAKFFSELGYGDYILQNEITGELFLKKILELTSRKITSTNSLNKEQLGQNSAKNIINVLKSVYETKSEKKA